MLTEREKTGIRAILDNLKPEDLYSLAYTVTKGYIKPENKDEAVQAVLLYCEKPSTLLRRKKVKKEVIFNYLRREGVILSVMGEKSDYIKACLQFWESLENIQIDEIDMMGADDGSPTSFLEETENTQPENVQIHNSVPSPYDAFCSLSPKDVIKMGHDFVVWFYMLMNQTTLGLATNERFDANHFMQDCAMSWAVRDVAGCYNGTVSSSMEVIQVLQEMIVGKNIVLSPGVEGVVTSYDPFGIVKIKVAGVVHMMNSSVGLFEQVFGLFRDPHTTNCWKIKRTDLQMQVNIALLQPETQSHFGYDQNTALCN